MSSLLLIALANTAMAGTPAASDCASLEFVACSDPTRTAPQQAAPARVVTVTASAATSGEALRRRELTLARLQTIRSTSGAGALTPSDLLGLSASRHADYLAMNGLHSLPSIHAEATELAGFSGADPFVRMRGAGYRSSYATELIGSAADGVDCVDRLMNSVYHAGLLLSRVTQVGLAYGDGVAARVCVIDLGAPRNSAGTRSATSGGLVRYPWPGMTLPTGTFQIGAENPRPAPGLLPAGTAGTPVLVGLREVDDLETPTTAAPIEIQQFELRDDSNAALPCVVLADVGISGPAIVADRFLHGGFVALVPRIPLAPGRYRVFLHATSAHGRLIAPAPWEFSILAP